ncbi:MULTISPECIES: hypothetical protein [Klebsiella]|uniref:hypothetical protein n=1 Tax=Klebsiella TaxID=570 RepID=UPI000DC7B8DA|nr:hypothetical protein [Klebsiella quasipneumoniae]AWX85336.1 hypothetical protein DP204_01350 [Klebsiella quasipneumoniae subsp. quasipneumoniae]QEY76349.1 hypothetical protein C2767_01175 [Klebsiella quasipneumoniae]
MLHLAISFAKKDLFIDKKMQWKMSQNSEQLAGNGDKDVFCDFDGVLASSALMMCPAALRLRGPTVHKSNLLPPEVLILTGRRCKKACSLSRLFEFGR